MPGSRSHLSLITTAGSGGAAGGVNPFSDWHTGAFLDDDRMWVGYIADSRSPHVRIFVGDAEVTRPAAEAAAARLLRRARSADDREVRELMRLRRPRLIEVRSV
jgi:hypothetical protein